MTDKICDCCPRPWTKELNSKTSEWCASWFYAQYCDECFNIVESHMRKWQLRDLAIEYHGETEEYDRKICNGPIKNGRIMPNDGFEMSEINKNARIVWAEKLQKARELGFSDKEFSEAIQKYGKDLD